MISNSSTSTLGLYDLKRQIDAFGGVDYFRPNLAGGYLKNARVMLANGDIVKSTVDGNANDPNADMAGWFKTNDASFIVDGNENQHEINSSLIRTVKTINDLSLIANPRNKQVAYVTENEKRYIYNTSLTSGNNGITVIGKWEMEIQEAYYASWFCEAESGVDESNKLQTGYTYATSKNRAFIIDIKVDVLPTISGDHNGNKTVIKILDNSCLIFKQGLGQLRLLPNALTNYYLISTYQAKNFAVFDADLIGDRLTHNYSSGGTHEWGCGLAIYECENGHFHKPRVSNMTGDGVYIGKSWGDSTEALPTNITIVNPIIERVRRNGLSLTSAKNLFVESAVISNVGTSDGVAGTSPMAGIDIEPESQSPINLKLINCRLNNTTISDCMNGMDVTVITESSVNADLAFTGITKIVRSEIKHLSLLNVQTKTDGEILFDDLRLVGSPSVTDIMWAWLETSLKLRFKNVSKVNGSIKFSVRGNIDSLFSSKCGGTSLNIINTPLWLGSDWVLANTVLKITSLVVKSNTNIVSSVYSYISYDDKTNIEGGIEINNGSVSTKECPVNRLNANLYAGNPCVVTLSDTRILEIKKLANSNASALLEITGFNFTNNNGDTFTKISTSTLGGYVRLFKKTNGDLEILEMVGVWTFS